MLLARGVVGRDVQRLEVVAVPLDLGALDDLEAHRGEGVGDLADHQGRGVEMAAEGWPARQRDVDGVALGEGAGGRLAQCGLVGVAGRLELLLEPVRRRADLAALLGRGLAQAAQDLGEGALAAQVGNAPVLELGGGQHRPERVERVLAQLGEAVDHHNRIRKASRKRQTSAPPPGARQSGTIRAR